MRCCSGWGWEGNVGFSGSIIWFYIAGSIFFLWHSEVRKKRAPDYLPGHTLGQNKTRPRPDIERNLTLSEQDAKALNALNLRPAFFSEQRDFSPMLTRSGMYPRNNSRAPILFSERSSSETRGSSPKEKRLLSLFTKRSWFRDFDFWEGGISIIQARMAIPTKNYSKMTALIPRSRLKPVETSFFDERWTCFVAQFCGVKKPKRIVSLDWKICKKT